MSKSLGAGAPARLDRLPAARSPARSPRRSSSTTAARPALDQLALARLIESGRYDRHLRRMRARLRRPAARRSSTRSRGTRPRCELTGLAAGFHAVARLPDGVDEEAVIAAARERSVGLIG